MPKTNYLPKFPFYQVIPQHAPKMALSVDLNDLDPEHPKPLIIADLLDVPAESEEHVDAQLWALVSAIIPPYPVVLINKHTGRAIWAPQDDSPVIQGDPEELFEVQRGRITWNMLGIRGEPGETGYGAFELNGSTRMCLDVKDGKKEPGTVVRAWGKYVFSQPCQFWTVKPALVPMSQPVSLAVHA